MASLPAPAFMSPPNLKPKFSTPVALAAVITPGGGESQPKQSETTRTVLPANPAGQFQLVLKTPSRNIKNLEDFMSSGPLTDPGQGSRRHKKMQEGDASFLSSASPANKYGTYGKGGRGRSARAITRSARSKNSNPSVSQSYQSNPFRSASVKKDTSNTLRRSKLPSKPAFSTFNRGSAKKRPSLTTLNGCSSSPNLIEPENDENAAPNTIPSPRSSNSPGKLALNPLEVPKRNSQQKGKRPNPNAKMPKQSQSTYKQQLLGMGAKAQMAESLSSQSASKVQSTSTSAPVEEMRTSARNLFKDTVATPSPGKKSTPKDPSESPLFKQVDSNERNRRRGVEKGTLELEFEEAGSATPGNSGSKHKPKDMMTKQITREELLQFMDNETEEVDAEMDEAISNIDIDETVAVLLSPTKKRRTPTRKSGQKMIQPHQHITPTVNLMSQKITPEVLNSLLVVESDDDEEGAEEDDTARMIDMDDGETSEEDEEELIGSAIDDDYEDPSEFPLSTDLMRKKFMPEDFNSINDEDIEEEVIDVDAAEASPMRVSSTFSEASEVEEDEGLGGVEDCIEGFKVSGCLSPAASDVDEEVTELEGEGVGDLDLSDDFAEEPTLDAKISSGEIKQLMSDFGRGEGKEGDDDDANEDSDDEVSLGGVFAGDIQMLGPWNDLDEYDVMYKVPLDINGKVKRRRRRNRHRFRPFHMSLWSIPETDDGIPMTSSDDVAKTHRRPSAPTVEDILYGSSSNSSDSNNNNNNDDENKPPTKSKTSKKKSKKSSSKNRIQEVITNSKPKTPTKARAPRRFNRRSQKILKSNGEEVVATKEAPNLGGTIDLGKTSSKLTIGNDTYGQWFTEQIGWGDEEDDEEDGFDKGEIIGLFGCIERKDFSGLSLALLGENGDDDCSLFHDVRDDYGNTLLMACCHGGFKRGVKLFVKNGWDPNARNKYGNTALHFAWERGQHKIAEYLKKKGADDEIRNEMGLTPYERVGVDE
ncbi:hypothetical protein TrST_g4352 [Triparma strigata]|uniref:Uncharacterized protein n=1 Tax=Triparma strigata TaxID=1606541 RepID=A0A9W7EML5_9STRA|nr:hypothetical protein TrST_g4352 [Triparma strigata]